MINQCITSRHPPTKQVIHLQANGPAQYCVMLKVSSNRFIYVEMGGGRWENPVNVDSMNSTEYHNVDAMLGQGKGPVSC